MSAINAALIGCGRIAWQFEHDPLRYKPCTHLGALRYWQKRDKNLLLSAFCDSRLENAREAARFAAAPGAAMFTDFRKVLEMRPGLLVIAADTNAHAEILSAAIRAKIPRIIVEKPVAFSREETKMLRKLVSRYPVVVLPNYERRYHPKYLQMQDRVRGMSKSYRGFFAAGGKTLYADKKTGNEGVLLHDTTHLLDLAQFFYGKITRYEAIPGKRQHLLFLEHSGGACGVLETHLGIGAFHLELELHTPRGRLTVGNGFLSEERIRLSPHYRNFKTYAEPKRVADKKFPVAKNPFVRLYEHALYGKPDNAHFLEALANVEILSR